MVLFCVGHDEVFLVGLTLLVRIARWKMLKQGYEQLPVGHEGVDAAMRADSVFAEVYTTPLSSITLTILVYSS